MICLRITVSLMVMHLSLKFINEVINNGERLILYLKLTSYTIRPYQWYFITRSITMESLHLLKFTEICWPPNRQRVTKYHIIYSSIDLSYIVSRKIANNIRWQEVSFDIQPKEAINQQLRKNAFSTEFQTDHFWHDYFKPTILISFYSYFLFRIFS